MYESNNFAEKTKPKKSKKLLPFKLVGILLIVCLAGVIIWQQYRISSNVTDEQIARTLQDKVANIMVLPEEDALVSTIEDINQVSEQPFFNKAQNGDKVLIFVQAAKIVIYRENTNQIVNAGPLIDDRTAEEDSATTTE